MIDAREGVAKETAERWLGKTFAVPMTLRSEVMAEAQAERAQDIRAAIFDSLPRADRNTLLGRCEDARKALTRASKAMTWPTPKEVFDAFKETAPKADSSDDAPLTEYVITSTARWVRKFDEWPTYLERPHLVFGELIRRGEFTAEQLHRAGYPKPREDAA